MKSTPEFYDNKFSTGARAGVYTRIYGYELETGDVLEPTDKYDSSSGGWELCPCPGLTIQAGAPAKWVRPV